MKTVRLRLVPGQECSACYYLKFIDHVRGKSRCPRWPGKRELKCTRDKNGKFRMMVWQVKT